jgi:hypothetical protein
MTAKRPPRLDLNPSSADRWTTCTASPKFILENWDKIPPSDTVYNQEGTTAHEVASALLQGREPRVADPYHCPVPVDKEMRWHGWNYMEYVQSLRTSSEFSSTLVEQKLPLWYMKERNAIVDAAVINLDSMHVIDYKYGEGVVVSPVENLQTAIYAMSVGQLSGPKPSDFPVFIHIYQPRGRAAEEGAEHVWQTTWLELCQLTEKVTTVAQGIQDGTEIPMFAPSEKACQWCPAKGFCTARQQYLTEGIEVLATIDENKKHFPPAQAISAKQLAAVLTHKAQIIKWLEDAEAYATEHLRAGGKLPGFKLVTSRGGNRCWSDPKKAAALLLKDTVLKREEVIEEKVIGPAAAEKLLGKKKFGVELTNLITKAPGVPVIAPESDKREAIGGVLEDFEVLLPEDEK